MNKNGYLRASIHRDFYLIHRLVLITFNPIEDYEYFTVDHINGIRNDNRLENLRWATNEENTMTMLNQRKDLNKELTRIIQIYGYNETLEILKNIGLSARQLSLCAESPTLSSSKINKNQKNFCANCTKNPEIPLSLEHLFTLLH